jgi:hypothetical protein
VAEKEVSTGNVPVPDPTVLTTQQLVREIAALREIFEAKIDGHSKIFDARVVSADSSIKLIRDLIHNIPSSIDEKVGNLRTLHDEKFKSIEKQFVERDTRTEQAAVGTKTAVDAALQAAKEANAESNRSISAASTKQEGAFSKQIDQQGILIAATTCGTEDKISDLKDRVQALESSKLATAGTKDESRANLSLIVSGIVVLILTVQFIMEFIIKTPSVSATAPQVVYVPAPPNTLLPATPPVVSPR